MKREDIAEAMAKMAAQFEAGEIDTVAFLAVCSDGTVESGYHAVGVGANAALVGAMEFAKADIIGSFGGTERASEALS